MSRPLSHINSATTILKQYTGDESFSSFAKNFFSRKKKYGSRDRKQISHLCYCYFRLGKALPGISIDERILIGLFLCSNEPNEILQTFKPGWNGAVHLSLKEKCSMINVQFSLPGEAGAQAGVLNVFPWREELSEGIDHEKFCESFFVQPDVYLRLRPGNEQNIKQKLSAAEINFEVISENCLSVAASTKVDSVIEMDKEAVIQDRNSQHTMDLLKSELRNQRSKINTWDCCAGSGGKSILAYDVLPKIELTVSDARSSIIENLKKRFANAGIRNYDAFVADLATSKSEIRNLKSQIIICDAPCTGSGTWSRTPEQLYLFDERKIDHYSSLQKKIISNVIPHVEPQGYFLYITCSAFKKENEENVAFIKEQFHLDLIKMELLRGYDKKADSLFVALLKKAGG